jgi:hypothetical protein
VTTGDGLSGGFGVAVGFVGDQWTFALRVTSS